jgi:hypothetical protein
MAVTAKLPVFWDVKSFSLVSGFRRFLRTSYFHFQGREVSVYSLMLPMEAVNSSEKSEYFCRIRWRHISNDCILKMFICSSINASYVKWQLPV